MFVLWSGILSGLLVIGKVSAVVLPEGSPDRTTACADVFVQGSCVSGEVIAVQSVQYGTKFKATCGLNNNSSACCTYDEADCFTPTYSGTEQQAACSGRPLCSRITIGKVDTSSCGGTYPILNHYITMEYYCIRESTRILSMSASSSLTATGSLLYIQNEGYPNKISASDTSGSCSVEVQDCSSRIKVYLVHFQLGDGSGSCTGTQQLQIDDDGTAQTLTCSDNTDFEITLQLTSTTNYITVTLGNSGGVNDGYFWLGLEGEESSGSVQISVSCPAAARTMCMDCPILTPPSDGNFTSSGMTTSTGTTVTVSCDPGFTLDGATTLTCQTDGSWDNTVGVCRPDCPGLSAPADGQVNPTTNVSTGQSAKYTCDAGFSIIGSDTRTCQDDGTWSGSQPVCGSLGSSCTVDADCTTVISHSTCDGGVCSCVDGYTQQNDECEETETKDPGLGSSCTVDADCTTEIAHSTCADGICSCADGYTQQNDECEETKTKDPEGLSIGVIIGIVIAVVVIVIAIIVLLFCCKKRDNREKLSMLWQRIKDKLHSPGEVNASLVHTPNKSIETKSSTPAPETDNAKNSSMEQKLKDNNVKEKTKSFTADQAEGEKTPISFSDFREAHLLHSNLNDIPSPIPPSPAQLYPELSSASLFMGINLQLIEEYPLHPNIPPAATNDMTETMRVTPESKSDIEQASSESSLSGGVSLPVSMDVSSRQDGGSTVQARELTPVSCP